ncbi:unnamed protein product [Clonostachys rosea f. rosea IK726]|uniref:Uncharacterized protein n=1 Tax=Clonostachys rosea f. rosea IK726 TaxID=1349383 RepID=A0ACA9UUR5_BIOOC|nr:unnamed protein product [Clonostachys rosea f. rosea IK726]
MANPSTPPVIASWALASLVECSSTATPSTSQAPFKDPAKIRELAASSSVLTVEIEHIDTKVLEEIDAEGVQITGPDGAATTKKVSIHPSWRTLRLVQDKFDQKEYLSSQGIPVADQISIKTGSDAIMESSLKEASDKFGFPWMLKSRKDSYDGRGNLKISGPTDFELAVKDFGSLSCYAERWVPFECELAVMVVRTEDAEGNTKRVIPFPVVETIHEDNVCSKVFYPPRGVAPEVAQKAREVGSSVVAKLWGRGVFAVEMFVTSKGDVLVNEIGPRPHNSGHLSIEAVPYMSQFKAQLTAILDEPFPEGTRSFCGLKKAKSMFSRKISVYPHLYGKESKPGRKIGHITLTGSCSIAELESYAQPLIALADSMRKERNDASAQGLRPQQAAPQQVASRPKGKPLVLVTMGSDSDLKVLKAGVDILKKFDCPYELDITSAHRTPDKMAQVAKGCRFSRYQGYHHRSWWCCRLAWHGFQPYFLAVIGVPVQATHMQGWDSLLSIVSMPVQRYPTATVAINNSTNAALLAIRILGSFMPEYYDKMVEYQLGMEKEVLKKAEKLKELDADAYLAQM